jgi:hypothetical protein
LTAHCRSFKALQGLRSDNSVPRLYMRLWWRLWWLVYPGAHGAIDGARWWRFW